MLFHIDILRRFSLGAARNQFRSRMEGPLLWRGSLVWPALCQTNSFHGSPLEANPLTKSFASKASDWDLGSVTPSPPCAIGSASVSHLTLAQVGASLPPQIKFLMSPLTWLLILGSGFQQAARYHIEARRTWLATIILLANERALLLQMMSLLLRASVIESKFASRGKWKPTWIPRYLVPFPFGIHFRPTSSPHTQGFSL